MGLPGKEVDGDAGTAISVTLPPAQYELLFTQRTDAQLRGLGKVDFLGDGDTPSIADIARRAPGTEVLLTGWGSAFVDEAALEALPSLKLVAHCAGSVRPVVTREAIGRGLRVVQAAGAMAPAVAEMCLTMTLCMLRRVHLLYRAMTEGRDWADAQAPGHGHELASSSVGVVGASRTGVAYLRMVQALGARTRVFDPYLSPDGARELGTEKVDLEELLASSDVVAVHAPSTPETHRLLGAVEMARVRDGGILVNTARPWVWDEEALYAELASGRLSAAIDVFDEEPLPSDHRLRDLDNVLLTPHVAGASVQARERQGEIAVDEVRRFLAGEPLEHEVTYERYDRLA